MSRSLLKWSPLIVPTLATFICFSLLFLSASRQFWFGVSAAEAGQASSPDLVVSSITDPPTTVAVGGSFPVTDTTGNSGSATAGASTTRYRLSTDTMITSSDALLTGTRSVPSLAKGVSSNGTVKVTIPTGLATGIYYLGACADDLAVVAESTENNNCRASTNTVSVIAAPSISSISPASGSIGTSVTITGSNFGANQGTSTITFNGVVATPSSWSNNTITAPVPSAATTGPVVVTVAGALSNGVQFDVLGIKYIYDKLARLRAVVDPSADTGIYNYDAVGNLVSISRQSSSSVGVIEFNPTVGFAGTTVTILGTGFRSIPSENTVAFNGLSALVLTAGPNELTVSVPVGATTGPISVTTPSGSGNSAQPFTVGDNGLPNISGFTPTVGKVSTQVTISGNNFDPAPSRDRLTFHKITTWPSASTATSLQVAVPVSAMSGQVSLATPNGQTTANGDFFVPPPPLDGPNVVHTGRMTIGGPAHTATIGTANRIALVLFDGTAGQQVRLNLSSVTFATRTSVMIFNPDGTFLTSQIIGSSGGVIGPFTLPSTGTYQIVVGTAVVTTFAGTGGFGASGDGGPATSANMYQPNSLARNVAGEIFISTASHVVRKVDTAGIISTVAGSYTQGFSGDGKTATKARLFFPAGIALDSNGNLFIADRANHRIRKVDTTGIITTVAGNGVPGFSGDGGPATSAQLQDPVSVAVDSQGNLYLSDSNSRIRKVSTSGIITTFAGTGTAGDSGDGGPAIAAQLSFSSKLVFDNQGNLFLTSGYRIRKIDTNGIITAVAGTGVPGFSGDGGPALNAQFNYPFALATYGQNTLFTGENIQANGRVRKIDAAGIIDTLAGIGEAFSQPYSGDGRPGLLTTIDPTGLVVDSAGNPLAAMERYHRVVKVEPASSGSMILSLTSP